MYIYLHSPAGKEEPQVRCRCSRSRDPGCCVTGKLFGNQPQCFSCCFLEFSKIINTPDKTILQSNRCGLGTFLLFLMF